MKRIKKKCLLKTMINPNSCNTKLVSIPSAQYETLCTLDKSLNALHIKILNILDSDSSLCLLDKALIECMYLTGCRVSQALNIKSKDISKHGIVKISGSKNGNSFIFQSARFRAFWIGIKNDNLVISLERNRFYIYRLFKKYGICYLPEHNSNYAITHAPRHLLLNETKNLELSKLERASIVGHKNENSQDYYINRKEIYNEKK